MPHQDLITRSTTEHRYRVESYRGSCCAVCACGWRSMNVRSAGVAGSLFDQHRDEQRGQTTERHTAAG